MGEMSRDFEPGMPSSTTVKPDLDKEWAEQADRLAYLFSKKLGKSRQQYIDRLPQLTPQPEAYAGRFDIPILV